MRTSANNIRLLIKTNRFGAVAAMPLKLVSAPSTVIAEESAVALPSSFGGFPSTHPSGHVIDRSTSDPNVGSTRSVSVSSFTCSVETTMSSGVSPGLSSILSCTAFVFALNPPTRHRSWWTSSSVAISDTKYSCVFVMANSSGCISTSNSIVTSGASRVFPTFVRATVRTSAALF